MAEVTIMGAGSWGLALAILLNNNGHHVNVWSVFPDEVELLAKERENKKCLPGVHIPDHQICHQFHPLRQSFLHLM